MQRGADHSKKDIYGNTPLGIALDRSHFNYGIILIQKDADVKVPVYKEYPNRLAKQWKDEEDKKNKELNNQDVDMEDEGDNRRDSKSHRDLFQKKSKGFNSYLRSMFLNFSDSESEAEDSDDSESSHGSVMEMNLI